jgi:outer membrane protein
MTALLDVCSTVLPARPRRRLLAGAWAAAALLMAAAGAAPASAQEEIAYVDSQYILEQVPEYATVQQRLDRLTKQWEQEIADQEARVDTLQKEFRARELLYTDEERKQQRRQIEQARQQVQQLRQRYFGPEQGRLYQRQKELMRPIQERVLAAAQSIAEAEGYDYVIDKSGPALFMYANPDLDLSGEVLEELGIDVDEETEQAAASSPSSRREPSAQP